ncbi:hypothetical protein [Vibrio owensii]|uniref:hypothetical protein n=1 Tax=Vibrio harveyi group TaxID=717610 RepID=UPI003CC5D482
MSNFIKSLSDASESQLKLIDSVKPTDLGELELYGYFNGDIESPMSIWVSVHEEDDFEEQELNDDIIYYGISVNVAFEHMIAGTPILDCFTVLSVETVTNEQFQAA